MAKKLTFWECENCDLDNPIDTENIADVFFCERCGVGHSAVKPINLEAKPEGNWLECIPLEGLSSRIPSGKTQDVYRDFIGNPFTREQFEEEYKIDPKIYLKWKNSGRPTGKEPRAARPEDKPSTTVIPPKPALSKAEKLLEDQKKGRMNLSTYLRELKVLLDNKEIPQTHFDQEKKRIRDMMKIP